MKPIFSCLFIIYASSLNAQLFKQTFFSRSFTEVKFSSVAFADIDGDTDLDVLVSGFNDLNQTYNTKLYVNDGQGEFTEEIGIPFKQLDHSSIAFADVDGDNDQDVLITGETFDSSWQKFSLLYINNGNGIFIEQTGTPFEGVSSGSVAFADIDGDSDYDVLITGSTITNDELSKLYINDGQGNFIEKVAGSFPGVSHSSIAFADIDGDFDQDLFISGYDSTHVEISKLYINDGAGNYVEKTGTTFEGVLYGSIAFTDVDGDSDQDLMITGCTDRDSLKAVSILYANDGLGNFTKKEATPFEAVLRSSISFADLDGDADKDLLLTGLSMTDTVSVSKLYVNDGHGSFTEEPITPFYGVHDGSIAFADVDGDTDLDVLITGESLQSTSRLYFNDGQGNYTSFLEGVAGGDLAFADVDGDSDQDLIISGGINQYFEHVITKLYLNDGLGNFVEKTGTPFKGLKSGSIAIADVDGDSDQDIIITGEDATKQVITRLYLNDGLGNFAKKAGAPFPGTKWASVAFADVDGDSDQDVFIAGLNATEQPISVLYLNDGLGNFTEKAGALFRGVRGASIAFADIDGDSDLDLLITGQEGVSATTGISVLYINDGNGNFLEKANTSLEGVRVASIEFSDVDNDNDLDLFISGTSNQFFGQLNIFKLYLNDGQGNFTEKMGTPFQGVSSSSIAVADIDGDTDRDLIVMGRMGLSFISKLYTNDGQGNYSEITETPFQKVGYGSSVAFSDIDGDNDQDLIITGQDSLQNHISSLYLNLLQPPTSIQKAGEYQRKNITFYPNPLSGNTLYIKSFETDRRDFELSIWDLQGKQCFRERVNIDNGKIHEVSIVGLSAGSYLILLRNQEFYLSQKLIIQD